jgi:DNA-binding Lrp family transcriptional regulator
MLAFVFISVQAGKEKDIYDSVSSIDEVKEVYELYGEYDLIAKIESADPGELDQIISEKIRNLEGVSMTSTMVVAR